MPAQLTGNQIRASFLNHFASKGHVILPSSSLVPDNDPTLMFTNSGMVQFKNNFTGVDTRLSRAATSQRCVRAGGKHNDLENVGHTARHHTFFEMLGNFSFGDYFKEESITWGWEWVTEVLRLDPSRLCVTVYHDDDEAFDIWNKKIGLKAEDIIRIPTSDNFWTMGDTGPCGPCSEIFYDLDPTGKIVQGGRPGTPTEDGDRWMEIWNHVFTQFDLQKDGTKVPLKNKNIDTGAGLERVMTATQGVYSNYDTDMFQAIIQPAARLTGVTYGKDEETSVSLRVIADHLRAMSFLMVDGVVPSNEGRGYVLRRIMRRAMRHGHLLGMDKPFINQLVPTLVTVMGEAYPELPRAAAMVQDVIKSEEERFGKALTTGLKILDEATKTLKKGDMLEGEIAFKLYDTYGFPLDLTQDALNAREIGVNVDAFQSAMHEQKQRARAAHKGTGDAKLADVWYDVQDKTGSTEFLGYTTLNAEGQILALVADNKQVTEIAKGHSGWLVTNQTPFYAESGGQVGDTGTISGTGFSAEVTDTQKVLDGLFIHAVTVTHGSLKTETPAEFAVSPVRRAAIARNHTATHVLFAALRDVLGSHVVQRGSRQDEHGTRFDISHPQAVTREQLAEVEQKVNLNLWRNIPVITRIMGKEEAIGTGATAQFGEKYADEVRVVVIGDVDSSLCGGTHVTTTGEIGLFRITGESSVAAGIRRIEGATHSAAYASFAQDANTLQNLALSLKTKKEGVAERIEQLQAAAKGSAKAARPALDTASLMAQKQTIGSTVFVGAVVPSADAEQLRQAVLSLKGELKSGVVLLASESEGKGSICAGVTDDLTARINAGNLVKTAAEKVGGKGGGKADLAQAGAPAGANLNDAISAAQATL